MPALSVAFVAFCVWLTVRLINRGWKPRRRLWFVAPLAVMLAYPLGFRSGAWRSGEFHFSRDLLIHDWSVPIGSWRFGICELDPEIIELERLIIGAENATQFGGRTEVHLGPICFNSHVFAYEVLGIGVVCALLPVAFVTSVVARRGHCGSPAA